MSRPVSASHESKQTSGIGGAQELNSEKKPAPIEVKNYSTCSDTLKMMDKQEHAFSGAAVLLRNNALDLNLAKEQKKLTCAGSAAEGQQTEAEMNNKAAHKQHREHLSLTGSLTPEPGILRTFARVLQQLETRLETLEDNERSHVITMQEQRSRLSKLSAAWTLTEHTRDRVASAEAEITGCKFRDETLDTEIRALSERCVSEVERRDEELANTQRAFSLLGERVAKAEQDLSKLAAALTTSAEMWDERCVTLNEQVGNELRKFEHRQLRLEDDVFRLENSILQSKLETKGWATRIQAIEDKIEQIDTGKASESDLAVKERRLADAIRETTQRQAVLEVQQNLLVEDARLLIKETADFVADSHEKFKQDFGQKWSGIEASKHATVARMEATERQVGSFRTEVEQICAESVEECRAMVTEMLAELSVVEQKRLRDRQHFEKKVVEEHNRTTNVVTRAIEQRGLGLAGGGLNTSSSTSGLGERGEQQSSAGIALEKGSISPRGGEANRTTHLPITTANGGSTSSPPPRSPAGAGSVILQKDEMPFMLSHQQTEPENGITVTHSPTRNSLNKWVSPKTGAGNVGSSHRETQQIVGELNNQKNGRITGRSRMIFDGYLDLGRSPGKASRATGVARKATSLGKKSFFSEDPTTVSDTFSLLPGGASRTNDEGSRMTALSSSALPEDSTSSPSPLFSPARGPILQSRTTTVGQLNSAASFSSASASPRKTEQGFAGTTIGRELSKENGLSNMSMSVMPSVVYTQSLAQRAGRMTKKMLMNESTRRLEREVLQKFGASKTVVLDN
ncbi:unnamed protein product [Amoebophrya sp. A25]|nr:unnamed protein product [Amoebophrya sp. A25]|eukprot:GSA25T00009858001.1